MQQEEAADNKLPFDIVGRNGKAEGHRGEASRPAKTPPSFSQGRRSRKAQHSLQPTRRRVIWCDNLAVVRGLHRMLNGTRQPKVNRPHSDLWLAIYALVIDLPPGQVSIRKIVSHGDVSLATTEVERWLGLLSQWTCRCCGTICGRQTRAKFCSDCFCRQTSSQGGETQIQACSCSDFANKPKRVVRHR